VCVRCGVWSVVCVYLWCIRYVCGCVRVFCVKGGCLDGDEGCVCEKSLVCVNEGPGCLRVASSVETVGVYVYVYV
jgi:hypothetical protein